MPVLRKFWGDLRYLTSELIQGSACDYYILQYWVRIVKRFSLQALQKMKRELRSKMEREIGELQKIIVQNDDDDYFHDLEVQRLRGRVQMASFQYNTSCLH